MTTPDEVIAQHREMVAWAKTLTDEQLGVVLNEMRDRGAAVAIYDPGEIECMFDGEEIITDLVAFMDENQSYIEEVMCEAARNFIRGEIEFASEADADEDEDWQAQAIAQGWRPCGPGEPGLWTNDDDDSYPLLTPAELKNRLGL